jgi:heat-inducible transcriptional repressor
MRSDGPGGDLTSRKAQILRAVILEYVDAAEPVASDLLAAKYELGVKSATIRHELAEITDLGFLEQPHTSAGRIPSDIGYRFYVDHLMEPRPTTPDEKSQVKSAQDDDETLKEILVETTKVLSRLTNLFAAAATVRDSAVPVKHVVVTALGPEKGMLVMVLGNGHVENKIVELPFGITLDQLGRVNEVLAASLVSKPLGSLAKAKPAMDGAPLVDSLLTEVYSVIRAAARDLTKGQFVTDGEEYILSQPEFQRDRAALEQLIRSLENEETLRSAVVGQQVAEDGVTIGRENQSPELQSLAISRRVFMVGGNEAGAIAVIGPTRQHYDRGLSILEFTAKAISETLTKIYS